MGQSKVYPLLSAAAKGSPEMVKLVLQNPNLDIDIRNEAGVNAFWIACMFGHGQVMSLLANAGLDIMCVNNQGVNVLHLAIK